MIDTRQIKQTENAPSGITVMEQGGLAINMDVIKDVYEHADKIRIVYRDGNEIHWFPVLKSVK